MSNMTLALNAELKKRMKQFPEVKWSEVARGAIQKKLENEELISKMNALTQKSKLTMKDAIILGRKINASASKRFRDDYHRRKHSDGGTHKELHHSTDSAQA